jgi:hypothetical protein
MVRASRHEVTIGILSAAATAKLDLAQSPA